MNKNIQTLFEIQEYNTRIEVDTINKVVNITYDPIKLLQGKDLSVVNEFIEYIKEIIEDYIDIWITKDFDNETINKLLEQADELEEAGQIKKRKLIPEKIHELIMDRNIRRAMILKCGKDALLYPEKLKFPVMYPVLTRNGQVKECKYHCGLIIAAYYRAKQNIKKHPEYEKIAQKALELYKKLDCEKKSPIKLHINENANSSIINLIDLYFEFIT